MNPSSASFLLMLVAAGLPVSGADEPRGVVDFGAGFDLQRVRAEDCRVSLSGPPAARVLRVAHGVGATWPGVTLPAPGGTWDFGGRDRLAAEIRNDSDTGVQVFCRVDNDGANGTDHCVTGDVTVPAHATRTLAVRLAHQVESKLDGKLFGLRGYPVTKRGPQAFDPSRVNQLLFFVSKPTSEHVFEVGRIRVEGVSTPPTAWVTDADPYFPLIDAFGQYRHKDWPGKVASVQQLRDLNKAETLMLANTPGPDDWDAYGGWKSGPTFEATGHFRTQKVDGRWWLVDPEGRLFFSNGIDCVRMLDATPIEERETWFESTPWKTPEFAEFLSRGFALKGHYAGKTVSCFSFAGANLKRKYGESWRAATAENIHRRLRHWGLNTIGMWSDEGIKHARWTPYVDAIGSRRAKTIEGSEGYWGKFPDVYDPSFVEGLRRDMEGKKAASASDPACIGYFADNEMSWGDETSLALAALQSPPEQAAKQAFLDDLKSAYEGSIDRLNSAWGTAHASWDALRASRSAPDRAKARPDLERFYTKIAETYFRSVRETIKASAPRKLYLGCRFAWVNARAAAAAAKYCDVVSYNLYQRSVADFVFPGGADVPLIIGEFHFGALDRGMFHTGLVPVSSQAERASAYAAYVRGALRHPQFVGCHWFQYQDEPTTGRTYDEENYQIGFVSIADVPYDETIAASREIGDEMYRIRSSQ